MEGAWSAFSAGAILDYAPGDAERSLHDFHGLPERYLRRWPRQLRTAAAALFAFDQAGVGEPGQDAGKQAAWNVGLGRDPLRRDPFPCRGKIEQGP